MQWRLLGRSQSTFSLYRLCLHHQRLMWWVMQLIFVGTLLSESYVLVWECTNREQTVEWGRQSSNGPCRLTWTVWDDSCHWFFLPFFVWLTLPSVAINSIKSCHSSHELLMLMAQTVPEILICKSINAQQMLHVIPLLTTHSLKSCCYCG